MDISGAGHGLPVGSKLRWAPDGDARADAAQADARHMMTAQLARAGYVLDEDAPLLLDLGVSERRADIAVGVEEGAALSPAKPDRLLQNCADRIVRLTMHVTDAASGEQVASLSAQEPHCHAQAADVLPRLSRELVRRLARPAGTERLTTLSRD